MTLNPTTITLIRRLLGGKNTRPLRGILSKIAVTELSSLFQHINLREKNQLIEALISLDMASTVLSEIPEQSLSPLLDNLERNKLIVLMNYSEDEHTNYFLQCLDERTRHETLNLLDEGKKERVKLIMSYPEESAGRIMSTRFFSLPANLTCKQATDELRTFAQDDSIYYIYCTDQNKKLIGVVSLRELVTAPEDALLKDLNPKKIVSISPETNEEDIALLFEKYGFIALPVCSEDDTLLGIVTVDEILDVLQDQVTSDIYATAGLQEDDRVYSSATKSIKNRLPWMGLNLILAALVSTVVSLFESTMNELIILATLNNIVAGMGGNTAIQSLTVFTRGMARGDFQYISPLKAVLKETNVGIVNGVVTGVLAGIMVYFWKGSAVVGAIICFSMFLNSLLAATVGSIIPLVLKKYNQDPAAGSGVLVTMLTDCFGFFSFLGTATLVMKYYGQI
ncbi:MAG: magnesium transporter [Bdellovibrionales bacterium]